MNQWIFVYPPSTLTAPLKVGAPFNLCLGAAYCISYLTHQGIKAAPFLTPGPVNIHEGVKQILARNPNVVGFTVYNSNYGSCRLMARALKKAAPKTIVVFGGPTASVQAGPLLETNDFVDICVRHEGEETCLELFSLLEERNFDLEKTLPSLEKVKGITYRCDGHLVRENPGRDILLVNRKVPDFLDKYPSPYLSGLLNSPELGILTARGCNRHCTYCNCAVISKRIIATHSTDRVIQELDYIYKKIGYAEAFPVDIFDDAFTLFPGRAREICQKIIDNHIRLPLACSTRCDTVDEELLEKMKEAGFTTLSFSLESAVPRLLRIIGKVHPPHTKTDPTFEKEKEFIEKLKKYTAYAKKIGIQDVSASIMIGLPTETPEEGQQTVEMIRSLGDSLDSYAHNIFQVLPGTPIFFNHESLGLKLIELENRIQYRTLHTYDTSRIQPAPRSHLAKALVKQNRSSLKALALSTSDSGPLGFFVTLILWADSISKEMVFWLQDCMAVDGMLLQIYSSLDSALRHHENNCRLLIEYIAPNLFHPAFYQTPGEKDTISLIPFGLNVDSSLMGTDIHLVNTQTGLSAPPGTDPSQIVCLDIEKEDTLQLHRFLVRLAREENAAGELFKASFTPYFSALCRWDKKMPNCRSLETVIVDSQGQVKTCWNGPPIGKVGMSLKELGENLSQIHGNTAIKRDCRHCPKQAVCVKCIFPGPLPAGEYCDLQKNHDIMETAELIRTFDSFKEL